jgi:hypothetical protein
MSLSGSAVPYVGYLLGASIQLTSQPVSGSGTRATYTMIGPVPPVAKKGLVGWRVNSECYSCNGPSDVTIYSIQYGENNQNPLFTLNPTNGNITAQAGQTVGFNSDEFGVTAGAQFPLTVDARVSPRSAGSGYFTLIWFDSGGNEPFRQTIMFQPQTQSLGTATTDNTGSFSINNPPDPTLYQVTASYAGSSAQWPAQAISNISHLPALVSLTPFQGTGPNATLTLVYSHPSGWTAIQSAEFIINPRWEPGSRGGGCYIKYAPGTGQFTLVADDGQNVAGSAYAGWATTISNSQCTLNAASSSATGSGTTLTVVAALTFSASFTGQRHIWMQATDVYNNSTNWLVYGVWFPTQTTVTAGPWYRIYDPFAPSYLYTSDQNEYNTLGAQGFVLQGTSGLVMNGPTTVSGISNTAFYRVFVNSTSSHFWTSDRNEFLTLINRQQAYVGEGVTAFVMPYINAQGQISPQVTNTIPFYRAVFTGADLHFWTSDPHEFFGTNGEHLPTGYVGKASPATSFRRAGRNSVRNSAAP